MIQRNCTCYASSGYTTWCLVLVFEVLCISPFGFYSDTTTAYLSGPPHDVTCIEVRKDSLVLLWKEPVYTGRSPIAGYYVDMKETEAKEEHWRSVNEKPLEKKFLKVNSLRVKCWYSSMILRKSAFDSIILC